MSKPLESYLTTRTVDWGNLVTGYIIWHCYCHRNQTCSIDNYIVKHYKLLHEKAQRGSLSSDFVDSYRFENYTLSSSCQSVIARLYDVAKKNVQSNFTELTTIVSNCCTNTRYDVYKYGVGLRYLHERPKSSGPCSLAEYFYVAVGIAQIEWIRTLGGLEGCAYLFDEDDWIMAIPVNIEENCIYIFSSADSTLFNLHAYCNEDIHIILPNIMKYRTKPVKILFENSMPGLFAKFLVYHYLLPSEMNCGVDICPMCTASFDTPPLSPISVVNE